MRSEQFEKYLYGFTHLRRSARPDVGQAPHKPVLLLALMAEIECGRLEQNRIELSDQLIASFHLHWQALITTDVWQPNIGPPFIRMAVEGFWHLYRGGRLVDPAPLKDIEKSIIRTRQEVEYASIDPQLWSLMMQPTELKLLKAAVVGAYFSEKRDAVDAVEKQDATEAQLEKLIQVAGTPFPRKVKPLERQENDLIYLRNRMFPKLIKKIYRSECAICGIAVNDSRSNYVVLDAAHIMDYSAFHNDDPRNGIALCKNHHAGFDSGCFSISADYRLIVNAKARVPVDYAKQGAPIRMPEVHTCAPAQDALAWHRNHKLR